MPSKSLCLTLVISASLSLAAIVIIPIYHEASAKECKDNGHDSCSDKQDSDSNSKDHQHSDDDHDSNVKKDKTPFVLSTPVPFP
jgi:hypothetical protein